MTLPTLPFCQLESANCQLPTLPTMNSLEFFVPGNPVAQPRPRAVRRGKSVGVYNPGTADRWKQAIAWCAVQAVRSSWDPIKPVSLVLIFTFSRPAKPHADWPEHHAQKPDLDNLTKAAMDALTDAGVWRDDALVCQCTALKRWAEPGFEPGLTVGIKTFPAPSPAWKNDDGSGDENNKVDRPHGKNS